MIKDITIGQFFPGRSPVHRLDPRARRIFTLGSRRWTGERPGKNCPMVKIGRAHV